MLFCGGFGKKQKSHSSEELTELETGGKSLSTTNHGEHRSSNLKKVLRCDSNVKVWLKKHGKYFKDFFENKNDADVVQVHADFIKLLRTLLQNSSGELDSHIKIIGDIILAIRNSGYEYQHVLYAICAVMALKNKSHDLFYTLLFLTYDVRRAPEREDVGELILAILRMDNIPYGAGQSLKMDLGVGARGLIRIAVKSGRFRFVGEDVAQREKDVLLGRDSGEQIVNKLNDYGIAVVVQEDAGKDDEVMFTCDKEIFVTKQNELAAGLILQEGGEEKLKSFLDSVRKNFGSFLLNFSYNERLYKEGIRFLLKACKERTHRNIDVVLHMLAAIGSSGSVLIEEAPLLSFVVQKGKWGLLEYLLKKKKEDVMLKDRQGQGFFGYFKKHMSAKMDSLYLLLGGNDMLLLVVDSGEASDVETVLQKLILDGKMGDAEKSKVVQSAILLAKSTEKSVIAELMIKAKGEKIKIPDLPERDALERVLKYKFGEIEINKTNAAEQMHEKTVFLNGLYGVVAESKSVRMQLNFLNGAFSISKLRCKSLPICLIFPLLEKMVAGNEKIAFTEQGVSELLDNIFHSIAQERKDSSGVFKLFREHIDFASSGDLNKDTIDSALILLPLDTAKKMMSGTAYMASKTIVHVAIVANRIDVFEYLFANEMIMFGRGQKEIPGRDQKNEVLLGFLKTAIMSNNIEFIRYFIVEKRIAFPLEKWFGEAWFKALEIQGGYADIVSYVKSRCVVRDVSVDLLSEILSKPVKLFSATVKQNILVLYSEFLKLEHALMINANGRESCVLYANRFREFISNKKVIFLLEQLPGLHKQTRLMQISGETKRLIYGLINAVQEAIFGAKEKDKRELMNVDGGIGDSEDLRLMPVHENHKHAFAYKFIFEKTYMGIGLVGVDEKIERISQILSEQGKGKTGKSLNLTFLFSNRPLSEKQMLAKLQDIVACLRELSVEFEKNENEGKNPAYYK